MKIAFLRFRFRHNLVWTLIRTTLMVVFTAWIMAAGFAVTLAVNLFVYACIGVVLLAAKKAAAIPKLPLQGRGDLKARTDILSDLSSDILGGRTVEMTVPFGKMANAFNVRNKSRCRIALSQTIWDLPIEQFFGIVLHEAAHTKYRAPAKPLIALVILASIAEVLLSAFGWGMIGCLLAAATLAVLQQIGLGPIKAEGRRAEIACDKYSQSKGGDIRGALQFLADSNRVTIGSSDPKPLPGGIEDLFLSHPTFPKRLKALDTAPVGVLDLQGYEPSQAEIPHFRKMFAALMSGDHEAFKRISLEKQP